MLVSLRPQHLQHFLAVVLHLHLGEDLDDFAFLVNDEGGADDAHVGSAVHLLLAPGTVRLSNLVFRIAEKGEGEVELELV